MKRRNSRFNNIVIFTLVAVGIICMILAFYPTSSVQKKASLSVQQSVTEATLQEEIDQETQTPVTQMKPSSAPILQKVTTSIAPTATPSPTTSATGGNTSSSAITANPSPSPTAIPTTAPVLEQVFLSINGGTVLSIDVSSGANQCDVLNAALSQGKIQSLNMRYNQDMQTYAVYQIDGVGKESAVWWVYKVNNTSPSQGCSYVKAHTGDSIIWEYKGS
jgi:hypothetical protein